MKAFLAVLSGIPLTILLTGAGFLLGALGGIPLFLLRRSRSRILSVPAGTAIDWLRAVPPIVWIFLVFYGAGSGVLKLNPIVACVIALGLFSSAYMAEIYRGGFLAISRDQQDASDALGFTSLDALRFIMAPQAIRLSIPSVVTYVLSLLKESSLAATIGIAEITFNARSEAQLTFEGIRVYAYAGLFYVCLSVPIAWLSRAADRRLRAQVAR